MYYPQGAPQEEVYRHQQLFTDPAKFLDDTLKAIFDERKAQLFYRALLAMATTPFQKRNIQHALDDEIKHEKMLTRIYHTLTGQAPPVPYPTMANVGAIPDLATGLQMALEDELEAAEHYRDMFRMTTVLWLRDELFELQTDEMEHATRFSFLRAEL